MTDKRTVELRYLKTFLVGPPGVGKTTTLNRLLKIIKNIFSEGDKALPQSTFLANCFQVFAFVSSDGTEWISSNDFNHETTLLFRYLCGCKLEEVPLEQSGKKPSKAKSIARLDHSMSKLMQVSKLRSQENVSTTAARLKENTEECVTFDTMNQDTRIKSFISRLQKVIMSEEHSALLNLLGSTLLNIHDIGGQPGFLEMLPALSTGPAMYLVFFDLSKELDKPYKIPFNREDTVITPYDALHTVEATISQILSSITSVHCISHESSRFNISKAVEFTEKFHHFKNVQPVAALVGTHRDQLKENAECRLRNINKALSKITTRYGKVVCRPNPSEFFFAVDNFSGADINDVGPIRNFMSTIFQTDFNDATLPISPKWLWLSLILRREYKIVSMVECLEIAKLLGMEREELDFALWYLHFCTGSLMYYPDIPDEWFENHIICLPQVVFDSISQLIVASLRTLHTEGPFKEYERKEMIQMGQFSLKSVEKYCSRYQVKMKLEKIELIPPKHLVQLLNHINLLSPITHKQLDGSERTTYLMPAVLECASLEELTTPLSPDDNNPEPLHITFSCGYVPTGTFCGLITQLVSRGPHGIFGLTWDLVEHGVKRNFVQFHVDYANKVTLICHDRCYELRVERNNSDITLHDLCTHVLSVILYNLKNLYKNLITQIAFRCPCTKHSACRGVDSLCTLISRKTSTKFYCDERCPVTLNAAQKVWIGKVSVLY